MLRNMRSQCEQWNTITIEDVHWVMSKFCFDDYIEPLTLYLPHYREDDGGEHGSLREKSFLKRPMVDADLGCSIMPYHLPPNFPMAHHQYFVYPPPMENGDMGMNQMEALRNVQWIVMLSILRRGLRSDQFLY